MIVAGLRQESTWSYVYLPRECHVQPFSGDLVKDRRTVDEFIDEVQHLLRIRDRTTDDQVVRLQMVGMENPSLKVADAFPRQQLAGGD